MNDADSNFEDGAKDDLSDYLTQMQKATEKIQKILNHLRNFSRRQAETRETTDVNNLLNDALFMVMNKIINQNVRVNRLNNDVEFIIHGSSIQLEQVFMNIISNSCDAMRDSAEKTLTITVVECDDHGNSYHKCTIEDSGCGIAKENLDQIFNSFFTTKKTGEGTGIGLSICQEILEAHDGKISVESEEGKGTTFTILLPRHKGE